MPELPEVETTRRGIAPHLVGRRITSVIVREARLRWPVAPDLAAKIVGRTVMAIERRAKYLLLRLDRDGGTLLIHLGMSGSLRVLPTDAAARLHDHVDVHFNGGQGEHGKRGGKLLRLHDPRRFGCLLHLAESDAAGAGAPARHQLLRDLGPEPLSTDFHGRHLTERARGRTAPVKCFLMDGAIVVGVGNIYANEALWRAGIHPRRAAGRVSAERFAQLATAVKEVLAAAIEKGGTTLRDFVQADGQSGYFRIELAVYDRTGQPCPRCATALRTARIGQRSAFFCPNCQR